MVFFFVTDILGFVFIYELAKGERRGVNVLARVIIEGSSDNVFVL